MKVRFKNLEFQMRTFYFRFERAPNNVKKKKGIPVVGLILPQSAVLLVKTS